jgi:peptidoglycan biosynthesis protein MviN/MurJ (putative lipid II flippase)
MVRSFFSFRISGVSGLQFFQLLRFLAFFLTGILFTRFGMPKAEIGLYETLLLVTSGAGYFWINGMINGLLSSYSPQKTKDSLFFNVFILLSLFSMAGALLLYAFAPYLTVKFGITDKGLFHYFIIYYLVNNPTFLTEYILLLKNRHRELIVYGILVFTIHLMLVTGPFIIGYGLQAAVKGLVLSAFIKLVFLLYLLVKNSGLVPDTILVRKYLGYSLPLIAAALIGGAAEYIDGFIVSGLFDKASLAVYRYGAKELPLTLLLANAFSSAMVAQVSSSGGDQGMPELIRARSARLMHLLFPVSAVLMLVSPYLYRFFFNEGFVMSALVFNTYLLLVISRLVFPQTILLARRRNRAIMFVALTEVIVNVVLSLFFARWFGIVGVALGTLFAYCIDKLIQVIILWRDGIAPAQYIPLQTWVLYTLMLAVTYLVGIRFI